MVSSYHIPPDLLEFELTETLFLKGFESTKH
jgi:EAL domain-containing protein (putative c-di-GMP-specific phosphodiesterase class I)